MISVDQDNQGDKSAEGRKTDRDPPVDGKSAFADREGIQVFLPPAIDREGVHRRHSAVREGTENADKGDGQQDKLRRAHQLNGRGVDFHLVEMAGKLLVLGGRQELVDRPQEQKPDQAKAQ